MALTTVTVTWDENDIGQAPLGGNITFLLSEPVFDSADGIDVRPTPKTYFFASATGTGTSDPLVANDNVSLQPTGSYYTVTVAITGQAPYVFQSAINHANGASQSLSFLQANAAVPAATFSAYLPLPSGTPQAGQVPAVITNGSTATTWTTGGGSGGGVTSVSAGDTSIVVGGTGSAPTIETGTLDVIATDHPPAAAWSNNHHQINSIANGAVSSDAAAFGQIPTALPPNGSAGGALTGTYPSPGLATVPIASGGTGQTGQQAAINALTGAQSAGKVLRSDGTNATLAVIQASDVPTLNQNTTGTAAGLSATLAIGSGGTGQASQQAALNALAGGTSSGQYLRGTGTNVALSTVQAADLPGATTSLQGAVILDGTATDIQPDGTQAAGGVGKAADAGHIHPMIGGFQAPDMNLLEWNFDPVICTQGSVLTTAGVVYLIRVPVRVGRSITNVVLHCTAAGATLTAGQNFAGVISSGGTLIGATADQSAAWTSTGVKSMALAGGPFTATAGFVWVALVFNGTTSPTFLRAANVSSSAANLGLGPSSARFASSGTGQTSLASITPSANGLQQIAFWAGLS